MSTHHTKNVMLPVTTRGIGFATCNLCYIAAAAAGLEPPLYAMYRLFLALAEAKLELCTYQCRRNEVTLEPHSHRMLNKSRTATIVPAPIKRIIDAMDVITHNGTKYHPVVVARVKDAAGRLVPRPEILLLSNLRETVVALSTADTPVEYRAAFKANCPIPGAIWDNDLLLNADEIMPQVPQGQDMDEHLEEDMWPVSMFLVSMQEKYPLMAGGPLLAPGAGVSKAALISNEMWSLRAKPRLVGESQLAYCKRCHPQGGLFSYYELEKISDADSRDGQVALLGELPNELVLRGLGALAAPLLADYGPRRQDNSNPVGTHVDEDYTTSLLVANEALLSATGRLRAAGGGGEGARGAPPPPASGNSRGRGARNRHRN